MRAKMLQGEDAAGFEAAHALICEDGESQWGRNSLLRIMRGSYEGGCMVSQVVLVRFLFMSDDSCGFEG